MVFWPSTKMQLERNSGDNLVASCDHPKCVKKVWLFCRVANIMPHYLFFIIQRSVYQTFDNLPAIEDKICRETKMSLVHMAGYVTRKDDKLSEEELFNATTFYYNEYGDFTRKLDRGGLNVPTDNICQWVFFSYILFNSVKNLTCRKSLSHILMLISSTYEFHIQKHHANILSNIFFKNYCIESTPRSSKEAKQKVIKLSDEKKWTSDGCGLPENSYIHDNFVNLFIMFSTVKNQIISFSRFKRSIYFLLDKRIFQSTGQIRNAYFETPCMASKARIPGVIFHFMTFSRSSLYHLVLYARGYRSTNSVGHVATSPSRSTGLGHG